MSSVKSVIEGDIDHLQGPRQTILKKEKTLLMQEAALTDESGSIRVVLWENDIRVTSGTTNKLSSVMVWEYKGNNYLTLNKNSTIESTEVEIQGDDGILQNSQSKVDCSAEGVQSIKRFLWPYQTKDCGPTKQKHCEMHGMRIDPTEVQMPRKTVCECAVFQQPYFTGI
jgi:hypothetical protein